MAALVVALFWPARNFKAITYDDPQFIFDEPRVAGGLSLKNARWALTSRAERNWIPLARWSHQLDATFFGENAGPQHLVSLLIHGVNAGLLAFLLRRLAQNPAVALLAALAWALHPLQVEAVAWLSNRKHLLAVTGAFAATLCWWRPRAEDPPRSGWAAFFLTFSLMARPTAVLLPLVWLCGDWLSGRFQKNHWRRFLAPALISAGGICLTIWAQALPESPLRRVPPLSDGIWIAPAAAAHLVRDAVSPGGLAFHYPVPKSIPWTLVGEGLALLIAAAVIFWRWKERRPLVALGIVWTIALWLPASGLVPAGDLFTADRFASLPLAGAALGFAGLLFGASLNNIRCGLITCALVVALWAGMARKQLMLWRDAPTLYASAAAREPEDPLPHLQLGLWHAARDDLDAAEPSFRAAVAADPECLLAQYNMAVFAVRVLRPEEALTHADILVREAPGFAEGHWLVSQAHYQLARLREALAAARRVLELDPSHLPAQARVAELTASRPRPGRDMKRKGRPPRDATAPTEVPAR